MLLDNSLGDLELATWLIGRLQDLRGLNPQTVIDLVFGALTGAPVNSIFVKFNQPYPAFYFGQSAGHTLFFGDGITTNDQATAIWDAYVGGILPPVDDPQNQWFEDWATYIQRQLPGHRFTTTDNAIYCGYSAGGAVAEILFDRVLSGPHGANTRYCTFGSPAPAGVGLQRRIGVTNGFRYMNNDDPVPLIPFGLANFVSVNVLYGGRRANRLANFLQPGGGLNINQDGFTFDQPIPVAANLDNVGSLSTWLFGADQQALVTHSLAEYRRRLTAAAVQRPDNRPIPRPREHAQRPDFGGRHERNRAAAASVRTIFANGERQNAQPEQIPPSALFRAKRDGRMWFVYFGESLVAIGPTKKRARGLARFGNEFCRRLLLQGYVDPQAIISQFKGYINLAQDPAVGFVPTLQTVLPN